MVFEPRTRDDHGGLAGRVVCFLAGAFTVLAGWFFPDWAPVWAAICIASVLATSRSARAGMGWREVGVAGIGFLLLAVKDLLTAGPLGRAAIEGGLLEGFARRQPDVLAALGHAGVAGLCIAGFLVLRVADLGVRRVAAWCAGAVSALAMMAAAVLTTPKAAAAYGGEFHYGELTSRNGVAGVLAAGAILGAGVCAAALRARNTYRGISMAACAVLCAAAVAGLGSRGGLLALAAGGGALALRAVGAVSRKWVVIASGVVIATLLLAPTTVARLATLREEYRLELWSASVRVLREAPWGGVGGGGFADAFALFSGVVPSQGARVTHPDSSWILWAVEWGLPLFAMALVALWKIVGSPPRRSDAVARAAEAAIVAWAVAAAGDVSFHRPVWLLVGIPILALARPKAGEFSAKERRGWLQAGCMGALVLAMAGAAMLERCSAPGVVVRPFDPQRNHELGFDALGRGALDEAKRRFGAVLAVDPANSEAAKLYARALMAVSPGAAEAFWRRYFSVSERDAASVLAEELARVGGPPRDYWLRMCAERPELWTVLADSDDPSAQRCYDVWRAQGPAAWQRSEPPATLAAMARWGTVADLRRWLDGRQVSVSTEAADLARMLKNRGRGDLAWLWLTHILPEPPRAPVRESDPGLLARVLANPTDHVLVARLIEQTSADSERLRLLERAVGAGDVPSALRIRFAYALKGSGRGDEALEQLLAAANTAAQAKH